MNNIQNPLSNLEKHEEAINYYDKAISLIDYNEDKDKPTYADALTNKGIAFTKLGKYARYSNSSCRNNGKRQVTTLLLTTFLI